VPQVYPRWAAPGRVGEAEHWRLLAGFVPSTATVYWFIDLFLLGHSPNTSLAIEMASAALFISNTSNPKKQRAVDSYGSVSELGLEDSLSGRDRSYLV
jgi:hypothetical protein